MAGGIVAGVIDIGVIAGGAIAAVGGLASAGPITDTASIRPAIIIMATDTILIAATAGGTATGVIMAGAAIADGAIIADGDIAAGVTIADGAVAIGAKA